MDSTGTTLSLENGTAALAAAVGGFVDGALNLDDVRDQLVRQIQDDPSTGSSIQELLESELETGRLTISDYTALVEGINAALSESVPTEASEEAPDRPGFYNIDHEGTLILAEEGGDEDSLIEAADSEEGNSEGASGKSVEIQVGSVLLDRYRLDEEIARGSMGMVYKAVDLEQLKQSVNDPRVAIKLISPEYVSHQTALKTFENEIANTRHLDHPNIVSLFALENEDSNYFISMEWLDGEALDELLKSTKGSSLPPVQTYAIIEQLCDALAYAHANGVVHADVKPGNVFLVKTGELKLIDFGIASIDAAFSDGDTPNSLGGVALTPAYASCERLERSPPTTQDDLYSLACMIYRLLAGRRVFGSLNALEAEQQGVEPVPIGEMDAARWAALRKALSFRREDRQQSVQEFSVAFKPDEPAEEDSYEPTAIIESLPEDLGIEAALDFSPHESTEHDDTVTQNTESHLPESDPPQADTTRIETLHGTTELAALAGVNAEEELKPEPEPGISDTELLESFADFQSLSDTALGKTVTDTTKIEALNETSELLSLAGEQESPGVKKAPEPSPLEMALETEPEVVPEPEEPECSLPPSPEDVEFELFDDPVGQAEDLPEETSVTDSPDTLKLETVPDALAGADAPGAITEPPDVVDPTVTLPNSLTPAALSETNIPHEGADGSATPVPPAPEQPAARVTVTSSGGTVSVPADDPPAPPQVVVPASKPKSKPKAKIRDVAAGKDADQTEKVPEQQSKRVTAQLRGGGQEQISTGERVDQLKAWFARLQKQPRLLAVIGGGVVLLLLIVTGLILLTGSDPEPVADPVQQPSREVPVAAETVDPLNPEAPIMLDLTGAPAGNPNGPELALPVDSAVAQAPTEIAVPAPVVPKPEPVRISSEFVIGLQSKTKQALDDGRLVKPANNSFVHWIERLRSEGGDMPTVLMLESEAAGQFIGRAEDDYIKGDMSAAEKWANLAEEYGATDLEIAPVRASIAKYKLENPRGAPKAAPKPKKVEKLVPKVIEVKKKPEEDKVDQTLIGRFPTVAMSELKFTRYVDPRYPSTSADRSLSGWVDVAFTVDAAGRPQNILVTGSNLPGRFEPPALAAVKSWRFEPYAPSDKPVVVNTAVRMRYDSPQ